jgi:hypothetical protein
MRLNRFAKTAIILLIAFSLAPCSQYQSPGAIKVTAKFPSKRVSSSAGKLAKPVGAGDDYVPPFIDKINVTIKDGGGGIVVPKTEHIRGAEGLSNLFEISEELPYGTYTFEIEAITINNIMEDVTTHIASRAIELGSSVSAGNLIIDLDIARPSANEGVFIDEVLFVPDGTHTVDEYCTDINEDGDAGIAAYILPDESNEVNVFAWMIDRNGVFRTMKIPQSLDSKLAEMSNCRFRKNVLIIPSYDDGFLIRILRASVSELIPSVDIASGSGTEQFGYLDIGDPKTAVIYKNSSSKPEAAIFDTTKLEEEYPEIAYVVSTKRVELFDSTSVSNVQIKFLSAEKFLVTAYVDSTHKIIGSIFNLKGSDWKKDPTIGDVEIMQDFATSDYSIDVDNDGNIVLALNTTTMDPNIAKYSPYLSPILGSKRAGLTNCSNFSIKSLRSSDLISIWSEVDVNTREYISIGHGYIDKSSYEIIGLISPESIPFPYETNVNPHPRIAVNDDGLAIITWILRKKSTGEDEIHWKRYLF